MRYEPTDFACEDLAEILWNLLDASAALLPCASVQSLTRNDESDSSFYVRDRDGNVMLVSVQAKPEATND
jgi:hypothetical protein